MPRPAAGHARLHGGRFCYNLCPPPLTPAQFAANPRINTALTVAIRAFKAGDQRPSSKPFVR